MKQLTYDPMSRPEVDPIDRGRHADHVLRHLAGDHAAQTGTARYDVSGCDALRAALDLCSQVLSALSPSSPVHERLV